MWRILDTSLSTAAGNMQKDAEILAALRPEDPPILHLYDWEAPSATYGHFIAPERFLDLEAAALCGLQLAKRPTGGGIVFHVCDLAFSVLVPAGHPSYSINTLDNYCLINRAVAKTVEVFCGKNLQASLLPSDPVAADEFSRHFCMAKPTIYDVVVDKRKIGGAAQRRTKNGFLHQGTISIAPPPEALLEKLLLPGTGVLEAMRHNSFSLLSPNWTPEQLAAARLALKTTLTGLLLAI